MRAFIISQPKSGTYLLSNLLANMGLTQTYLHLSLRVYYQYDGANLAEARANPQKYQLAAPLENSVHLVPDNAFAVGHLPRTEQTITALQPFKNILTTRNHVAIRNSYIRWAKESGRGYDEPKLTRAMNRAEDALAWYQDPAVYVLPFDDMINVNVDKIDGLQRFLFDEVRFDSQALMRLALSQDSKTKSSLR